MCYSIANIVIHMVKELTKQLGREGQWELDKITNPHEANYLKLDCTKVKHFLTWKPNWSLDVTLSKISEWYISYQANSDMQKITYDQISSYINF